MARERILSEARHGPPVASKNPAWRLAVPHRGGSVPADDKEVCEGDLAE